MGGIVVVGSGSRDGVVDPVVVVVIERGGRIGRGRGVVGGVSRSRGVVGLNRGSVGGLGRSWNTRGVAHLERGPRVGVVGGRFGDEVGVVLVVNCWVLAVLPIILFVGAEGALRLGVLRERRRGYLKPIP